MIVRQGTELTVISPVRLSDHGEKELRGLGIVRHVVKIGYFHGLDDAYFIDRFDASYWALANGTREQDPDVDNELKREHLPIRDAELFEFQDTIHKEAAILIPSKGGLLITCDSVQHWQNTAGCSPLAKLAVHKIGFRRRPAQIGPPWMKKMTPKGSTLQRDYERLLQLKFTHLIGAHGQPLIHNAKSALSETIDATF